MSISTVKKNELIEKYRTHESDTGSPEVQVAILTERVFNLTKHLKVHRKDFATRRGLLMLVGQRSALLRFLKAKSVTRYKTLIQSLGIRK